MNYLSFLARAACFLLVCVVLFGCGKSGGSGGTGSQPVAGSNRARFEFDIDLQGVPGVLIMEVEVVRTSGVTWGPGVSPDITAVISTGGFIIFTAGEVRSSVAYYIFTGENDFADFTEPATFNSFRVQWIETRGGMTMVVDPFGPSPIQYDCVLTKAELL